MKSLSDIRHHFLEYFKKHDHQVVSSSSLVPDHDPTLLFTNAGMVPFKNVFTGIEKKDFKRAVSAQKCVRAGGKHNDLENVGHTGRHHTFFEMLGNFSFGDYFKDIAIHLAWNLLTKEFGLSPKKLLVTVFSEDEESARIWKKITGFPDSKIIRINTSDNFWSMGSVGPCGPCSEIFYDHGSSVSGGPPGSANEDGDRFVEIWNLVFMQYEQVDKTNRRDLPKPSIDTGMGLERMAAVLQGKHDNYQTDLFQTLIQASMDISKTKNNVSHRVLADHLRSSCFLMADGVLPSNEGRGYVLRRIMRRAMRHAHKLGCKAPLMHKLVPTLVEEMGQAYPELNRAQALMTETLKLEEDRFRQTLEKGLKILEQETQSLKKNHPLPGAVAFKLYDTYGFPVDLTQDVLKGDKRGVDMEGFTMAMAQQKKAARDAWSGSGHTAQEQIWFDLRQKFGQTEFLGYDTLDAEGIVIALIQDGKMIPSVGKGQKVLFLCNQTPFYGASGGQMGDNGEAISSKKAQISITDTHKKGDSLHVHEALIMEGTLAIGDTIFLKVNGHRRNALKAHHSATHLLHKALRKVLGDHVMQKGSLVAPHRLRFDFSSSKPLLQKELHKIEDDVNDIIRRNTEVQTHLMHPEKAIQAGALALFGEKYTGQVRVVSMGEDPEGGVFSLELCGGTHVHRTGDIGYFKIISEGGIASGIRRIEALVGEAAEFHVRNQEKMLSDLSKALKVSPLEMLPRLNTLMDEKKNLEKQLKEGRKLNQEFETEVVTINTIQVASQVVEDLDPKNLKPMVDELKKKMGSGIGIAASSFKGKASLVVGVTQDLTKRFSAIDLVIAGAQAMGGKGGGGRVDMAQAGGTEIHNLSKAVDVIKNYLK